MFTTRPSEEVLRSNEKIGLHQAKGSVMVVSVSYQKKDIPKEERAGITWYNLHGLRQLWTF